MMMWESYPFQKEVDLLRSMKWIVKTLCLRRKISRYYNCFPENLNVIVVGRSEQCEHIWRNLNQTHYLLDASGFLHCFDWLSQRCIHSTSSRLYLSSCYLAIIDKTTVCADIHINWYLRYLIWVSFGLFFMFMAACTGYQLSFFTNLNLIS